MFRPTCFIYKSITTYLSQTSMLAQARIGVYSTSDACCSSIAPLILPSQGNVLRHFPWYPHGDMASPFTLVHAGQTQSGHCSACMPVHRWQDWHGAHWYTVLVQHSTLEPIYVKNLAAAPLCFAVDSDQLNVGEQSAVMWSAVPAGCQSTFRSPPILRQTEWNVWHIVSWICSLPCF